MKVWRLNTRLLRALLFCLVFVMFISYCLMPKRKKDNENQTVSSTLYDLEISINKRHEAAATQKLNTKKLSSTTPKRANMIMHVASVICGNRLEEGLTMIKSALIFTKQRIHFHIVSELELQDKVRHGIGNFPWHVQENFEFTIYNLSFPEGKNMQWKTLFKTCASQRLFLMNFLMQKKILYLDTDTLVLSPLEKIWDHFSQFNNSHISAMTNEAEVKTLDWYPRFARHPFYGKFGLNSGAMLMDLNSLRKLDFTTEIVEMYKMNRYNIVWGDQDLLNIYFNKYPERVYVYSCEWNYRPDHCMYGNNCETAVQNGIYVLHGNRGCFTTPNMKHSRRYTKQLNVTNLAKIFARK